MRILLDPGTFDCANMGDVAMLQVAVERVRGLWPTAEVHVLTEHEAALAYHCPEAKPAPHEGRRIWLSDHVPLGPLRRLVPARARSRLAYGLGAVRSHWPAAYRAALVRWRRFRGDEDDAIDAFLDAVRKADLLLVCGQGTLTDAAREHATMLLTTGRMMLGRGRPIALVGQGIGPLRDPALRENVAFVLSAAAIVGLRERRVGPRLLQELRVPPERVVVTGDEAVELAYRARRETMGSAIGVHVRLAPLAAANRETIERLRPTLHEYAVRKDVPLLPLPISRHERGTNDVRTIAELLAGPAGDGDGGAELDTPAKVIAQASRCRIVVTGAYHAAVFALSQGIPVVCLARSEYYLDKFRGLADLFGPGCDIVHLDDPALPEHLVVAMNNAWRMAEQVREPLREAAARQVALAREAYERIRALAPGER